MNEICLSCRYYLLASLSAAIIFNTSTDNVSAQIPTVTFTESAGILTETSSLFSSAITWTRSTQIDETWFLPQTTGQLTDIIVWLEPGESSSAGNVIYGDTVFSDTDPNEFATFINPYGTPFLTSVIVNPQGVTTQVYVNFVDLGDSPHSVPEQSSTVLLYAIAYVFLVGLRCHRPVEG